MRCRTSWAGTESSLSGEMAPVVARRMAGEFVKSRRERARFAKPDIDADLGDRQRRDGQQILRPLHAAADVVAVGRHPEGLLERTGEMKGTEAHELRQVRQRDLVAEMLLDEFRHPPL